MLSNALLQDASRASWSAAAEWLAVIGSCVKGVPRACRLQGELEITTVAGTGRAAQPDQAGKVADLVERVPFLMLALDLPPAPLYKDALEKNIIPQARPPCTVCCAPCPGLGPINPGLGPIIITMVHLAHGAFPVSGVVLSKDGHLHGTVLKPQTGQLCWETSLHQALSCTVSPALQAQVPIYDLLRKFDGGRVHDDIKAGRRRFRLTRLPRYLALHMKRFTKNNFFWEKNPTIVNFPVRNLELRDIVPVPSGAHASSCSQCWEGAGAFAGSPPYVSDGRLLPSIGITLPQPAM